MRQFHRAMSMSCRLILFTSVLLTLLDACWSSLTLSPPMLDVVRYVNDSYLVACSSNNTDETGTPVVWTRKNKAFSEKGHPHVLKIKNDTALYFDHITKSDEGDYSCRLGDEVISFKLIVISPILFVDYPAVQTAQEHRTGFIKCKATGDPKPEIVWKFQGRDLPSKSKKYEKLKDGLKIFNVSVEDRGAYICRAYQVSQVTSMLEETSIKLNVQHKPLHKKPVHAKVNQAYGYIGGTVNLTCEAVAEPAANFTWFRQHKKTMPGRIIEELHWSILQLVVQNSSVFGDYLCKATNEFGTLDQIITLQEGVKPPGPQNFKLKAAGSDSLELEIVGPNLNGTQLEPNMMPTGYRIQYRVKEDAIDWPEAVVADFQEIDEDPYVVFGLVHNTLYEVRVATRNAAGLSDFTPAKTYRTLRLHADSVTSSATPSFDIHLRCVFITMCCFLTFTKP